MGTTITLSSQNINGFARNQTYVKELCDTFPNSIRAFQEHWMKSPLKRHLGVNKLRQVHDDFDGWGTSAMRDDMENHVRVGRLFGGTGYIWNKKFSLAIKPQLEYKHDCVTVIELNDKRGKILLINAYMPYFSTNQLDTQLAIYVDTLGFIESIMEMNDGCSFILLSDLNCNLYKENHPFSVLIRDLMQKRNLVSTYDFMENFDPAASWSRKSAGQNGTESRTLIDFILVSNSISSRISNVRISDYDKEEDKEGKEQKLDVYETYISWKIPKKS